MSFLELVSVVAAKTGLSRRDVRKILKTFVDCTSDTLNMGEKVVLPGFGVFYSQETKSRPLFGGTRTSSGQKKIKFRTSRRRK